MSECVTEVSQEISPARFPGGGNRRGECTAGKGIDYSLWRRTRSVGLPDATAYRVREVCSRVNIMG